MKGNPALELNLETSRALIINCGIILDSLDNALL